VLPRIGDVGLLEAVNGLVEDGVILRVLARVVDGLFMVGRSQEVTGARAASRNTRSAEGKLMRRPAIFPPRHLSCTGSWTCNPSHPGEVRMWLERAPQWWVASDTRALHFGEDNGVKQRDEVENLKP
jgi:hypothetical protein